MRTTTFISGNEIRALREKTGLNQTDFWKVLGVGQSGGSRYELGLTFVPACIYYLLILVYGSEDESRAMCDKLREACRAPEKAAASSPEK